MKKITLITNIILLAIVFVACKQNKPEPVVEKYYTHLYRSEFKEIQAYVTENHIPFYELLEQIYAESSNGTVEKKPEIKVTDIKCEIQDDTVAFCSCLVQDGDQTKEHMLQLKKVNKQWLVNQGKEENIPTSSESDEEEDFSTPAVSETAEEE